MLTHYFEYSLARPMEQMFKVSILVLTYVQSESMKGNRDRTQAVPLGEEQISFVLSEDKSEMIRCFSYL